MKDNMMWKVAGGVFVGGLALVLLLAGYQAFETHNQELADERSRQMDFNHGADAFYDSLKRYDESKGTNEFIEAGLTASFEKLNELATGSDERNKLHVLMAYNHALQVDKRPELIPYRNPRERDNEISIAQARKDAQSLMKDDDPLRAKTP